MLLLTQDRFDGASIGDRYEPPVHRGLLPTRILRSGKLYTGSCHCGALTVAVVSTPLNESYEHIVHCNCSVCHMVSGFIALIYLYLSCENSYSDLLKQAGCVWVYPKAEPVILSGDATSIVRYPVGHEKHVVAFCKQCGVPMTNEANEMLGDQEAAVPEVSREALANHPKIHAVNARVLSEVDLSTLQRLDV